MSPALDGTTPTPESGPPFDPAMDLPGVPHDWRVLWCPHCGYAVIWDSKPLMEEYDAGAWRRFLLEEAAVHDCPCGERHG